MTRVDVESPVHVYQEIDTIDQTVSKGLLMKIYYKENNILILIASQLW